MPNDSYTEIAAKENIRSGIPLTASHAVLHHQLVSHLYKSPNIPLDVFDKIEVVREERYCVPAYCFYCNGTTSFTYEAGNQRQHKTAVDLGDRVRVEKETYMEWTQMSGSASITATLFAPGHKKFTQQVEKLYMQLDPGQLVDIEELDIPLHVETYSYNLPQPAAFNEYVKPHVDKLLRKEAEASIRSKTTRNFSMGGSNIQKETVCVFLGLYHVVYTYDGQEYSMWTTGGGKTVLHDKLPTDSQRQKVLAEKQQLLASIPETSSLPQSNVGCFVCLVIACVIGAYVAFSNAAMLWAGLFVAGTVLFGAMLPSAHKKGKVLDAQRAEDQKILDARRAEAKKDIEDFETLLPTVVQRFKEQKKALRGIYEGVSGDAGAF